MSQAEHLGRLMSEIGPALGLAAVLEHEAERQWELVLTDGFSLWVDYEGSDDRLTFTGDIIELGSEASRNILVRMLQYNAGTAETGGVRLALDEHFHALQIYDTPVAGMSLDELKTIVLDLADKIVAWRGALESQPEATQPTLSVSSDEFLLRV